MAGEQTAGRGRGRGAGSWSTNRGNLAVSFVHFPTAPQADWFALSYAAGLALARVLVDVCGFNDAEVGLKWPNDVFVRGAKIGGLLLETAATPQGVPALVLGMGVNLAHAPQLEGAAYRAESLRKRGYGGPEKPVILGLIEAWDSTITRFDRMQAPRTSLFRDWQAKAMYLNETITVRLDPGQRKTGVFIGLDEQTGALRLRHPDGTIESIVAGDVGLLGDGSDSGGGHDGDRTRA